MNAAKLTVANSKVQIENEPYGALALKILPVMKCLPLSVDMQYVMKLCCKLKMKSLFARLQYE